MKNFSVSFTPQEPAQVLTIDDHRFQKEENWLLKHIDISDTAIAAVAIYPAHFDFRFLRNPDRPLP